MIHPCRVIKIGGSLFARDNYATRLTAWFRQQAPMHSVIIAGGGVWADAVRRLDRQYGMPTSTAHWMAIRAMSVTSWLLACAARELQYADRFTTLVDQLSQPEPVQVVFDTLRYLQFEEPNQNGVRLPHGWHVTSDSIAARLADVLGANELVLLKSLPADSLTEAIHSRIVDDYFETAAAGIDQIRIEPMA